MQHQDGKYYQARKCITKKKKIPSRQKIFHQCVSLRAKKNRKRQNTEVMKFKSENRRLATILAVLPRDEHSWSLVRNSDPIFLSVLYLHWARSRGHLREYYQHRYYFFGFGFLATSRSCRPKYPLMIFVKTQARCPELDVCQSLSGI